MWNVHHLLLDIVLRALDMSVIETLHYSQRVLQWSPIRTTTDVPVAWILRQCLSTYTRKRYLFK